MRIRLLDEVWDDETKMDMVDWVEEIDYNGLLPEDFDVEENLEEFETLH